MPRSSLKKRVGRARSEQNKLVRKRRLIAAQDTEAVRAEMLKIAQLEDNNEDPRAHHLALTALLAITDLREYQEKRA